MCAACWSVVFDASWHVPQAPLEAVPHVGSHFPAAGIVSMTVGCGTCRVRIFEAGHRVSLGDTTFRKRPFPMELSNTTWAVRLLFSGPFACGALKWQTPQLNLYSATVELFTALRSAAVVCGLIMFCVATGKGVVCSMTASAGNYTAHFGVSAPWHCVEQVPPSAA